VGFYRVSRNIEASLIAYIKLRFTEERWNNIEVVKSFAEVEDLFNKNSSTAVIAVRASDTNRKTIEIGSNSVTRAELVLIDVFATSDGQRLDLVDFLGDELKYGCPYFEYQTEKSEITSRIQNGRIRINNIEDKPVNFGTDKSALDVQDRYRHLISITVSLGKVEA